jgi:oxygen-independent coproporphyrinogen-3 oxidase
MIAAETDRACAMGAVLPPESLIRKYDTLGPRYTSYPTADRFREGFGANDYLGALAARKSGSKSAPLSIYCHLPFCESICYYCGCNKVVTKDKGRSAAYVDRLIQEIDLVAPHLDVAAPVTQLHWGGGTPTFLQQSEMAMLMERLRSRFAFADDAELSIEVDPRRVDRESIAFLRRLGFNRMSLGIQDFDPAVQLAVNRVQGERETRAILDAGREFGFTSLNVDLIYGLPLQTVEGFRATLDQVVAMAPDRIALYSYAHVPHLFKSQRGIDAETLPSSEVKLQTFALAVNMLGVAGYRYIGMDHFARPGDELAIAQDVGRLHRNFQGYSTQPDCDLVAFGVSAIGKIGNVYVQNVRALEPYYERLELGALPTMRGYRLDDDDILRRDVITQLMCCFELDFREIEAAHGIDFGGYFAHEISALQRLVDDGIVTVDATGIRITPLGRFFVRIVAMVFDRHLRQARERTRYSRVI